MPVYLPRSVVRDQGTDQHVRGFERCEDLVVAIYETVPDRCCEPA